MLTTIQNASIVAKILAMQSTDLETDPENDPENKNKFEGKQLSIATLVYLATLGGARVCDIDDLTGSFKAGKSFDALLITMPPPPGGKVSKITEVNQFAEYLERFLFTGDAQNISTVWVQGVPIGGTTRQCCQ
jgi:guanine deaminase